MVKNWDLETNRVIRSYHGHLSGVYTSVMLCCVLCMPLTGDVAQMCTAPDAGYLSDRGEG